jgi:hypothetical protein
MNNKDKVMAELMKRTVDKLMDAIIDEDIRLIKDILFKAVSKFGAEFLNQIIIDEPNKDKEVYVDKGTIWADSITKQTVQSYHSISVMELLLLNDDTKKLGKNLLIGNAFFFESDYIQQPKVQLGQKRQEVIHRMYLDDFLDLIINEKMFPTERKELVEELKNKFPTMVVEIDVLASEAEKSSRKRVKRI